MNCNSFQQLTKDTVRNRKKVSSTLKEEIYRHDSSVKEIKFHRKIAVLIPVNFPNIFKSAFLQNNSRRLLNLFKFQLKSIYNKIKINFRSVSLS